MRQDGNSQITSSTISWYKIISSLPLFLSFLTFFISSFSHLLIYSFVHSMIILYLKLESQKRLTGLKNPGLSIIMRMTYVRTAFTMLSMLWLFSGQQKIQLVCVFIFSGILLAVFQLLDSPISNSNRLAEVKSNPQTKLFLCNLCSEQS